MRLNHVTIAVSELERSIAFYESLGLSVIVHSPPRYARLVLPQDQATFSLEVMPGVRPETASVHLYFECDSVDETYDALVNTGVSFSQQPTDMSYLWREARLIDPDGYDVDCFLPAGIG